MMVFGRIEASQRDINDEIEEDRGEEGQEVVD